MVDVNLVSIFQCRFPVGVAMLGIQMIHKERVAVRALYGMETGNHKYFCDQLEGKLNQPTNNKSNTTTAVIMPDLFCGNPILQPWFQNLALSEYRGSCDGR